MTRNYRKEYDNYQGRPEQIKNRAKRNAALALIKKVKGGKPKGDVHHKDGNPRNNSRNNLEVRSESWNRSHND